MPTSCGATAGAIEVFPTSPLILEPWKEELPVPKALAPVPKSVYSAWSSPPGPGLGQQDSDGGTHQIWPSTLGLPDPIVYQVKLQVGPARVTSGKVLTQVPYTLGTTVIPAGTIVSSLPYSAVYGFNGLPWGGVRINAEYGKPCLVRFENHLDLNPYNLDRLDFGAADLAFLTHLHNGHTAPESDGQPHYKPCAYQPGEWVDNLYLNWPAANDDSEKQSFFWFHDHRMDHTGANVYKGMVGLFPIYDPDSNHDMGVETKGYRLPGVRTNNSNGSFDVEYDIPMAFYDCRLDDGATQHQDFHTGCGETHPEWWGQLYFRHFPNHGYVGDVFTVNGKAFPYKVVQRRRYRLRFLDASIARQYQLKLMRKPAGGSVKAFPGLLGQYNFADSAGNMTSGQQCMKMVQIAPEGGLLQFPFLRDGIEIWPAKRREVIVDFSKYQDGSPTSPGDEIYLTNILQMSTGRKADSGTTTIDPDGTPFTTPAPDPNYAVPLVKFIIADGTPPPDNSKDPLVYANGNCSLALDPLTKLPILTMRAQPNMPRSFSDAVKETFTLVRSGTVGGEIQWLIRHNGGPQLPFDPLVPMCYPVEGSPALWTIENGGGGWTHPLHIHEEEHRVISRNGVETPRNAKDPNLYNKTYSAHEHPDDVGKEDVVALDPSESVVIWRRFRDFTGPYVCHCHNLAHEDHAMMFGWTIV